MSSNAAGAPANTPPPTVTTIISKKNLLQQLPAGSVLAFQTLAASFTNQGNCLRSNFWLTVGLVTFLTATCIFFSFTDSVRDEKSRKIHKGVALPGRLHILNLTKAEQKAMATELKKRGLKPTDWVHAFLSAVVFLTIAGNDVGLQNCFFPDASDNTRQLFRNLPLGMAVMASFLFVLFPTTRNGISFDDSSETPPLATSTSAINPDADKKDLPAPTQQAAEPRAAKDLPAPTQQAAEPQTAKDLEQAARPQIAAVPPAETKPDSDHQHPAQQEQHAGAEPAATDPPPSAAATAGTSPSSPAGGKIEQVADKALTTSANLLRLLPTGTVLAYQTLSASFTNQGKCGPSNLALTIGLVTFLGATCVFFPFTDSVKDSNGRIRKGVALPERLYVFNMPREEQRKISRQLKKLRLKTLDWVHAFFTLVVFLTIAGSDVGLQNCFFPKANDDTKQLLKNLPLGMAVMSSFVFMIFPTTRKGILFDDSEYSPISTSPSSAAAPGSTSNAPATSTFSTVVAPPHDSENPAP